MAGRTARGLRTGIAPWSVALWLAVWQIASIALGSDLLLPAPIDVLARLAGDAGSFEFWGRVAFTLLRVAAGFAGGVAVATLCAVAASRWRRVAELLAPPMALAKTVPVAAVTVLALIWLRPGELSVLIVLLVVVPLAYEGLRSGIAALDTRLIEMTRVLRVPVLRRLRYIYLPGLAPAFEAACSAGWGMAWKACVAAEIIAIPAGSVGEAFFDSKVHFDTAGVLSWTVAVVVLSLAIGWAARCAFERISGRRPIGLRAPGERAEDAARVRGRNAFGDGGLHPSGRDGRQEPGASGGVENRRGSIIRLRGVSRVFDGGAGPEGVSFEAAPGHAVQIMAPSGAGKTTVLRIIAGLEAPDGGAIEWKAGEAGCDAGRPARARSVPKRAVAGMPPSSALAATEGPRISMVFQEDRLIEGATGLENVRLAVRRGDAAWDAALPLMAALGIEACAIRPVDACSGGQRRRIALARALLAPHDALLLDEPFSGLDSESRAQAASVVRELEGGRIVVAASHDPADADLIGAEICRLR